MSIFSPSLQAQERGLQAGSPRGWLKLLGTLKRAVFSPLKRPEGRAPAADSHSTYKAALVITALFAACVLPGCKPAHSAVPQKNDVAPVEVRLTEARRGEITRYITLPAQVAPNQQVTLYSKVGGYLKRITVDRGDEIAQGELIAEIEVPELLADLGRCKAEVEIAELEYKRAGDAHQKAPDLIVRQTVDTAKAKFDMARANLDRIETLLSFCKITAPFSGVITRRTVDPGAFVPAATSGSSAQSAAMVTLSDFSTVRVQVAVPEPEVPLIKRGLPVKVTVEELSGQVFEGTITRFSQALDEASKTMLAEIDLKNPKRDLRPGMFASAKIGVEKRADTLLLPSAAVLFERSGASVFTVNDNTARKVPVKAGFNDGAFVEILEGLQSGDPAILVGKMALANGQSVNVTEGK